MKRVIKARVTGFPSGIFSIVNSRSASEKHPDRLYDPTFFPPHAMPDSGISVPELRPIGALAPDLPMPMLIAHTGGPHLKEMGAFIIYGQISYSDIWEKDHQTTFCTVSLFYPDSIFTACPVFNNMK